MESVRRWWQRAYRGGGAVACAESCVEPAGVRNETGAGKPEITQVPKPVVTEI
jgi:hypothetical protein